jgi:stearoyl-CoA desaturase (delta-9 desaturase)
MGGGRMKSRFVPDSVVTYILLHAACLLVFVTGVTWRGLAIFGATYVIRMLGVGIGYHRYFSHRTFKTSRPMQFAIGVWSVLALQKGPLWWAQTHRDHHRHADSASDLHSPRLQGFVYSHVIWFLLRENDVIVPSKIQDFYRFPEVRFVNDWRFYFPLNLVTWVLLYYAWGLEGLVWGGPVSTTFVLHLAHSIQSFSHAFGGYRRCPSDDFSRNHVWIGLLSLGEWHNNHHYLMSSARQGFAWWELDVQWLVLRAFKAVGLIWDLREPSREVLAGNFESARIQT